MRYWLKIVLAASYLRAFIGIKMRRKVTFGRCFHNNFWSVRNSKTRPYWFRKISFRAWIWTQILYVYVGNRKSYGCFYLALGVTRNLNSNSGPIEGHKSGSPTFCSRIWVWNIFPMSQGQSSQNLVFGQKFVAGKLFTRLGRFESVLKSVLRSPFQP